MHLKMNCAFSFSKAAIILEKNNPLAYFILFFDVLKSY